MATSELDFYKAPLLKHLIELRRRLIICLLFFILVFGFSYFFSEQIYRFLMQPLETVFSASESRRMIYTGLHEAFFTYLKLALFSSLFITLPIFLMQLWHFISPGLYTFEKKFLVPLFVMTPI